MVSLYFVYTFKALANSTKICEAHKSPLPLSLSYNTIAVLNSKIRIKRTALSTNEDSLLLTKSQARGMNEGRDISTYATIKRVPDY